MKECVRRRLSVIAVLSHVLFLSMGCHGIRRNDANAEGSLATVGMGLAQFAHAVDEHRLSGVSAGSRHQTPILFIHGTPGDWKAWKRYLGDLELQENAFMLAVDRPGFGQSGSGASVLSMETQAALIMQSALKEHPGPFIIVGHSYGGPIQLEIAADFPENVSSLIILAGALDPDLQGVRWYHHLANTCLGQIVLPPSLKVSTQEMISLPGELERLRPKLKEIQKPVTVIQGEKDWLVPWENVNYAQNELVAAELKVIKLAKQGHFLPWREYDLVKERILQQIAESVRK